MDERMTMTTILGIDCAVKEGNVGVAIGKYDKGMCALTKLPKPVSENWILEFVCDSINESTRTLLALDAPLGWPAALGSALFDHSAGNEIYAPSNLLFRRATDRFIKTCLDKQPLDVGADRIARTAKAALDLLGQVREQTGFSIPLVWNASFTEKVGAVEVYPAGTLLSYGLPNSGYKGDRNYQNTVLGTMVMSHQGREDERRSLFSRSALSFPQTLMPFSYATSSSLVIASIPFQMKFPARLRTVSTVSSRYPFHDFSNPAQ
jgi:hypothetical protein